MFILKYLIKTLFKDVKSANKNALLMVLVIVILSQIIFKEKFNFLLFNIL